MQRNGKRIINKKVGGQMDRETRRKIKRAEEKFYEFGQAFTPYLDYDFESMGLTPKSKEKFKELNHKWKVYCKKKDLNSFSGAFEKEVNAYITGYILNERYGAKTEKNRILAFMEKGWHPEEAASKIILDNKYEVL